METFYAQSVSYPSPHQLWQRFCEDDASALGQIAELFYRPLLSYGLRLSTDREGLKDLLQELFVDLWTHRHTLQTPIDVKAYLLGAFRNKIYKQRLQHQRLPQFVELAFDGGSDAAEPSIETALIQDETQQDNYRRIRHLLADLPKRQQEVIYLHYYEGMEAEQVAHVMNIGRQSVYNLLSRTLKDLRTAWMRTATLLLGTLLFIGALSR